MIELLLLITVVAKVFLPVPHQILCCIRRRSVLLSSSQSSQLRILQFCIIELFGVNRATGSFLFIGLYIFSFILQTQHMRTTFGCLKIKVFLYRQNIKCCPCCCCFSVIKVLVGEIRSRNLVTTLSTFKSFAQDKFANISDQFASIGDSQAKRPQKWKFFTSYPASSKQPDGTIFN